MMEIRNPKPETLVFFFVASSPLDMAPSDGGSRERPGLRGQVHRIRWGHRLRAPSLVPVARGPRSVGGQSQEGGGPRRSGRDGGRTARKRRWVGLLAAFRAFRAICGRGDRKQQLI
jgi:hypothetical protein